MSRVETTQQYKVQGPDGMEHVIEGPTGASDDEIIEQAKLLFPSTPTVKSYDTALNPADESQFKVWKSKYAPNDSGDDYDLRGAFKAGITPDPRTGHWPDTFKKPNHPTFSVESKYATGSDAAGAGHWNGDKFIAPGTLPVDNGRHNIITATSGLAPIADPLIHGGIEGIKELPGMAGNAIKATMQPPTKPSEVATFGAAGPLGVAAQRLVVEPTIDNFKDFWSSFQQTGFNPSKPGIGDTILKAIKAVPLIGPAIYPAIEKASAGDMNGALEEVGKVASQYAATEGVLRGAGALKGGVEGMMERSGAKAATEAAMKAKYPYAYTKAVEPMAEAFGVKSGESRFMDFADNADIAMDEINKASKEQFGNSPQSNRQQIEAGKTAMNKIYNEEIGPKVALVENLNLAPLRDKLIAEIPDSFSPAERRLIEKGINDQLTRSMSGTEAEKLRQKFSAADRVEQAVNNYVGAALQKTPRGYLFKQMDLGLRDYLADAVNKVQPGTDIRQALKRYGAVTDITQQAGGIPVDKTTMEMITGRAYITGTTPNITGRIVEAATKKWYANDNLIRRAYAKYEGPVTRPVKPRTGVDTLSGNQQDLISYPDNTDIHGVPPANSSGPLFDNLLQGQNIPQAPPMGRRMPESMQSSNNAPVNSAESLIRRPVPATEVGPATPLRTPIQARMIPRQANPMPTESQSTVVNRQALYGRTTGSPQLTSGPFRFEIRGKVPTELNLGSAAETPRVVQSTSSTSGSMSNRYPPNWQLDSTTYEQGRSTEATGQGNLVTADPKVVENTIAAIQKYISDHKPRGAKLTELQATRDDLLKQLRDYKADRGAR